MLKININNNIIINPNEKIRNNFRKLIGTLDDLEDEELIDVIYEILENTKNDNYKEYILIITLIYKDLYCNLNYNRKSNEINDVLLDQIDTFDVQNIDDIINLFDKKFSSLLTDYMYLLSLNNLFYIKILLSIDYKQKQKLSKIQPLFIYDELALNEYTNFSSLEDYYQENKNKIDKMDIILDIINFLDYLYCYNKNIYEQYIYSIVNKIYKYSYYYLNNSVEAKQEDLEIKLIKIMARSNISQISEFLHEDKDFLKQIINRIFNNIEIGYPDIQTISGYKKIDDKILTNYIKNK